MNTEYTTQHGTSSRANTEDNTRLPPTGATDVHGEGEGDRKPTPKLQSDIPNPDLSVDFEAFLKSSRVDDEKLSKRKSNLLKLNEENEKLKAELKAMSDRLAAAERKRAELLAREQKGSEGNS